MKYRLTYQWRKTECKNGSVTAGRKIHKTFDSIAEREEFIERGLINPPSPGPTCYRWWSHAAEEA